ncbi:MAG: hypothetical protein WBG92_07025 [Thiohalocapsa sp.]
MIFHFRDIGEEIGTVDTKRPNPNLGRFRDDQIRAGSAGIGVSLSSMARNFEGNDPWLEILGHDEDEDEVNLERMAAGAGAVLYNHGRWDQSDRLGRVERA